MCVFVHLFGAFYYSRRQQIRWNITDFEPSLNADIINVKDHTRTNTHTHKLSLYLSQQEVTEFNESWSVAVCSEG